MATISFDLVSPEQLLFKDEVGMIIVPGKDGDIGVLPGHSKLLSSLRPGRVMVYGEDKNLLKSFIKGKFKGKSNEVKISSEEIRAQAIDSFKWAVSGRIKISDYPKSNGNNKDKSWKVGFGFSVKEETSRGDKVPFSKIEILDEGVEITEENNSVKAKVTNIKNFAFKGELDLKSIIQRQNPKLCAINFYTS